MVEIVALTPKVGRNDPRPCGSDRKYKRRCGGVTVNERSRWLLKFEQDLSKKSGIRGAILEEKTEESAVRTIESKGFL
jgi:hypothetical protein